MTQPNKQEIIEKMAEAIRDTHCNAICACTGKCWTDKATAAYSVIEPLINKKD